MPTEKGQYLMGKVGDKFVKTPYPETCVSLTKRVYTTTAHKGFDYSS